MKHLSIKAALLLGAAAAASCGNMKQIKHQPYPETVRGDVVDNYFGTEVPDPYRWLEDDNSEATAAWVAAENAVTQDYLSQIPFRGAIRERLTEVWNYAKESAPRKHGDWWYYTYNDGLQNQSVIYRTKEPGEAGEVFFDPNKLSDDGTVALTAMSFSKDGRWFAYSAAASGSDWVEIRVMDTADKSLAADKIEWVITAPTTLRSKAPTLPRTSSRRFITTRWVRPSRPTGSFTRIGNIRCVTSRHGLRRTANGSSS